MRFLVDENFPTSAARKLVALGHDVVRVGEVAPGMPDHDIAAWAARENRIILTSDKDFGEIMHRTSPTSSYGVVLFRLPMSKWSGDQLADIVHGREDWSGHLSVVTKDRVRMRPLGR